jgi:hypothetical protein
LEKASMWLLPRLLNPITPTRMSSFAPTIAAYECADMPSADDPNAAAAPAAEALMNERRERWWLMGLRNERGPGSSAARF